MIKHCRTRKKSRINKMYCFIPQMELYNNHPLIVLAGKKLDLIGNYFSTSSLPMAEVSPPIPACIQHEFTIESE